MQLPPSLRRAVEEELTGESRGRVAEAVAELSRRYRARGAAPAALVASAADRAAYLAVRMPATYAAVRAALAQVKLALPEVEVKSLLDLGAGPGTAMWAAAEAFAELGRITLAERDREMIELGRRLARHAEHTAVAAADWRALDLRTLVQPGGELAAHDLVIASYALGELNDGARQSAVRAAWQLTQKVFVMIEPGTVRGFGQVLRVRDELIALGAHVVAPCPHARRCPMAEGDWCHFAARIERSSLHRRAKAGALGHEDEKFSYVAAARIPPASAAARVVRRPQQRVGHLHLDLCAPEGLKRVTLSKKDQAAYKLARKVAWGDRWETEERG
jgi:ribosomal protein RSM22 (predicted rRNA methylase)